MTVDYDLSPSGLSSSLMSTSLSSCVMSAGHVSHEWIPCKLIQY